MRGSHGPILPSPEIRRIMRMTNMNKTLVSRITANMVADGVRFLARRTQEGSSMSIRPSEAAQTRRAVSNTLKGRAGTRRVGDLFD